MDGGRFLEELGKLPDTGYYLEKRDLIEAVKRSLNAIEKVKESPELKLGQKWEYQGLVKNTYLLSRIDNKDTTFALVNVKGTGTWTKPKLNLCDVFGPDRNKFKLLEDV